MTLPCLDLLLSQVWLEKMLTHFFQQENTSTSNKWRAWCQRSRAPHRSQPHPHWKIERWATPWQKARAGYWQSFKKPDFLDQTTSVRRVLKVSQVEITVGTEFLQQHYQLWWSSFDKGPGDPGSGRLAMKSWCWLLRLSGWATKGSPQKRMLAVFLAISGPCCNTQQLEASWPVQETHRFHGCSDKISGTILQYLGDQRSYYQLQLNNQHELISAQMSSSALEGESDDDPFQVKAWTSSLASKIPRRPETWWSLSNTRDWTI